MGTRRLLGYHYRWSLDDSERKALFRRRQQLWKFFSIRSAFLLFILLCTPFLDQTNGVRAIHFQTQKHPAGWRIKGCVNLFEAFSEREREWHFSLLNRQEKPRSRRDQRPNMKQICSRAFAKIFHVLYISFWKEVIQLTCGGEDFNCSRELRLLSHQAVIQINDFAM